MENQNLQTSKVTASSFNPTPPTETQPTSETVKKALKDLALFVVADTVLIFVSLAAWWLISFFFEGFSAATITQEIIFGSLCIGFYGLGIGLFLKYIAKEHLWLLMTGFCVAIFVGANCFSTFTKNEFNVLLFLIIAILTNIFVYILLRIKYKSFFGLLLAAIFIIAIMAISLKFMAYYSNKTTQLFYAQANARIASKNQEKALKELNTETIQKNNELSERNSVITHYTFYTLSQLPSDIKSISAGQTVVGVNPPIPARAEMVISYNSTNAYLLEYSYLNKASVSSLTACQYDSGFNKLPCVATSIQFMNNTVYKIVQFAQYGTQNIETDYFASDGTTIIAFPIQANTNDNAAENILSQLAKITPTLTQTLIKMPYQTFQSGRIE